MKSKYSKALLYGFLNLLVISSCNSNSNSSSSKNSEQSKSSTTSSFISSSSIGDSSTSSSSSGSVEEVKLKDKNINVYLIGGQSNAVGYGLDTNNMIANSDERFVTGFDNVLYYGAQERWSGHYPNQSFEPLKLGYGVDWNRSGAEIGIASAVADNGEMNAVIKCAWGATHLYPDTFFDISKTQGTWTSPTYLRNNNVDVSKNPLIGRMYTWFEETVLNGINLLKEEGYNPIVKGMWWMQGEAEMYTVEMASAYEELLDTLIMDVRQSVSNITGSDYSEMPFVFGLPSWNKSHPNAPAYEKSVRNAMISVANDSNVINANYVDCSSLVQHDTWHFDAAGQKYLGESFVERLEELQEGNNAMFYETIAINDNIEMLLDESGMKFSANIVNYDAFNEYEYGMLFVPKTSLLENNITKDYVNSLKNKDIKYIDVKCEVVEEKINETYRKVYIEGSIKNIEYKDLNTHYVAIAYIKDGDNNYLYSASNVGNSISYLASKALYTESENLDSYKKYVDAGVNYALNVPEADKYQDSNLELEVEEEILINYSNNNTKVNVNLIQNPNVNYYVKYSSLDESIVSIDEEGYLTANALGETHVLVECGGKSKTVKVIVDYGSENGVKFDGVSEANEYLGEVVTCSNANVTLETKGMVIDGKIYLSFTFTHGAWAPYSSTWYENDNIEFVINNGPSHKVVFYGGEPSFSNGISQGAAKTVEVGDKLVTTVELSIAGEEDQYTLTVGMNGKGVGWLGEFWSYDNWYTRNLYITNEGVKETYNVEDGVTLDGSFDDEIYTEQVKNNSINFNANGADVTIMGTLLDKGVIFGATINHKTDPNKSLGNGSWYTFLNLEFHFNSDSSKQFIATCKNQVFANGMSAYCKTVSTDDGYTSYFEIFVPYSSIGVANTISSIDFTVNGWIETGWCWCFNTSDWNATHTLTKDGITLK